MQSSGIDFSVPNELHARRPPEQRGVARDEVRLLVAGPAGLHHVRFKDIKDFLNPGDLVVVNTSATIPAAVDGTRGDGRPVTVHFSSPIADSEYVVELRAVVGPFRDVIPGERLLLPGGVGVEIVAAHPDPSVTGSRLWTARIALEGRVEDYLSIHGRPITYAYVRGRRSLTDYQTIFSMHPGSAEMPSAGRPFSPQLVTELVAKGVNVAPLVLHTGVSSPEIGERPPEERFEIPTSTAWLVNETRAAGGRLIAAGTTVTRALETVASPEGIVSAGRGATNLELGPHRPARVVDGLITGWHEPRSTHLMLLEAVAGRDLVQRAYDAAIQAGYLWHEFGDSCLYLRERTGGKPYDE